MKNIVILATLITFSIQSYTQCVRQISTNPENPYNLEWNNDLFPGSTESFLNTNFNWSQPFSIDKSQNWANHYQNGAGGQINMQSPYSPSNGSSTYYLWGNHQFTDRDWHWEDGWELMYMNVGLLPNGDATDQKSPNSWSMFPEDPFPDNVPYFVLYNRYRGTLRLFANIWFTNVETQPKEISVNLSFLDRQIDDDQLISGILRHVGGLDRALDQKTVNTSITSPRITNESIGTTSQWFAADFQLAYDPCQCKTPTRMRFNFGAVLSLNVDLEIREVSIDKPINELTPTDKEFLNYEKGQPGNYIYSSIENMLDAYNDALDHYNNELNDYNSIINQSKILVSNLVKDGIGGGIGSLVLPTDPARDFLLDNQLKVWKDIVILPSDSNEATKWADELSASIKDGVASQFDFLNVALDITEEPIAPQVPVATFTEGRIVGTITDSLNYYSQELFVPGTAGTSYNFDPTDISSNNFPIYNQTPGLFALLDLPSLKVYSESNDYLYTPPSGADLGYFHSDDNVTIQPSNIQYALNSALDFDLEKTTILGSFVIKYKSRFKHKECLDEFVDYELQNSNYKLNHRYIDTDGFMISEYISEFYELKNIHNVIFKLNSITKGSFTTETNRCIKNSDEQPLHLEHELLSLNFKIAADCYFNQIGSNGEQVNNFQVFTYKIWHKEDDASFSSAIIADGGQFTSNDSWVKYLPGTLILEGIVNPWDNFVWNVSGNKVYVKAEDVQLKGIVGPSEGYELIIEAINTETAPNAQLLDNTEVISKQFYDFPKSKPIVTEDQMPAEYCKNKYRANSYLARDRESNKNGVLKINEVQQNDSLELNIYPQPANHEVNVKVVSGELKDCTIRLIGISGQVMIQERIANDLSYGFAIDVENFPSGYYILELRTGHGLTERRNLIINH
jgi:hypothetical protein